jgi:hypothetical protein
MSGTLSPASTLLTSLPFLAAALAVSTRFVRLL